MLTDVQGPGPVVVMGVSGSGKTTVGAALARRLGVPFADADDLHPSANLAKMSTGQPLDDEDRAPWLALVGEWLAGHPDGCVVACSALRRRYRDRLREHCPEAIFVHLHGDQEVVGRRQAEREGHFMPASLIESQYEALEPLAADERGCVVDVAPPVEQVVQTTTAALDRA